MSRGEGARGALAMDQKTPFHAVDVVGLLLEDVFGDIVDQYTSTHTHTHTHTRIYVCMSLQIIFFEGQDILTTLYEFLNHFVNASK